MQKIDENLLATAWFVVGCRGNRMCCRVRPPNVLELGPKRHGPGRLFFFGIRFLAFFLLFFFPVSESSAYGICGIRGGHALLIAVAVILVGGFTRINRKLFGGGIVCRRLVLSGGAYSRLEGEIKVPASTMRSVKNRALVCFECVPVAGFHGRGRGVGVLIKRIFLYGQLTKTIFPERLIFLVFP